MPSPAASSRGSRSTSTRTHRGATDSRERAPYAGDRRRTEHAAPRSAAHGRPARGDSRPVRGESGPARSDSRTFRSDARPARTPSRPARTESRPVRPDARRSIWDDLPVQIVATENLPGFGELGLPSVLVSALVRAGISTPFPIQAATIPDVIAGRDLLGRAATGSGKTLAFGLPMITRLEGAPSRPRRPRGLVLVPTRELAMQVADAIAPLAASRSVSVRIVAGGLPMNKQITALDKGVDILVATPGRLVDLIERGNCALDHVEVTVLDEADHMADLGFLPVVRELLDQTKPDGQRLLFSATLDGDVATLVTDYLTDPAVHALHTAVASVDTMSHHLFRVEQSGKLPLVSFIAAREGRTILFLRTKHGVERMADQLRRRGVRAVALHGDRSQSQRNRALAAFKDGTVDVLVATDVAARGIHVDGVSLVLHVDPPADHKDYLHRSGRTARAGESGTVVLLASRSEERTVRRMLTAAGVNPVQRDAAAGDSDVVEVTGAREPSGVAVNEDDLRPKPTKAEGRTRPEGRTGEARTSRPGKRYQGRGARTGRPEPRRERAAS